MNHVKGLGHGVSTSTAKFLLQRKSISRMVLPNVRAGTDSVAPELLSTSILQQVPMFSVMWALSQNCGISFNK